MTKRRNVFQSQIDAYAKDPKSLWKLSVFLAEATRSNDDARLDSSNSDRAKELDNLKEEIRQALYQVDDLLGVSTR
jgi:hypothetical protein